MGLSTRCEPETPMSGQTLHRHLRLGQSKPDSATHLSDSYINPRSQLIRKNKFKSANNENQLGTASYHRAVES